MTDVFPEALIANTRVMTVKHHTHAKNMVPYAVKELSAPSTSAGIRLLFHAECRATYRLVAIVEIVKRELLPAPTYQWTRFYSEKCKKPVTSGLPIGDEYEKKTYLEVLLSTVPFEEKSDSQQCSTDEFGSALPSLPKTVPPIPLKRRCYVSEGKEVPTVKRTNQNGLLDALLPAVKAPVLANSTQRLPTNNANNKYSRRKRKA